MKNKWEIKTSIEVSMIRILAILASFGILAKGYSAFDCSNGKKNFFEFKCDPLDLRYVFIKLDREGIEIERVKRI